MPRLIAVTALLLGAALVARAEDRNTITVHGKGTVSIRPDRLLFVLNAAGKAEKAADAVVKLKEKTGKIRTALDAVLKNTSLKSEIKDTGLSFVPPAADANAMMMMGQNKETAEEVSASTEINLTINGVDKMEDGEIAEIVSTLLDKAVEAGAEIKPAVNRMNPWMPGAGGAGVYFGFSDYDAQSEKAWDDAVKKAKDRAEAIARRLGLTIGDAVRIKDLSADGPPASDGKKNPYAALYGMVDDDNKKVKSSGAVDLSVEIEVEFELKKK